MVLHEIGLKYGTDKATFHEYLDFYQKKLPSRKFTGRLLEIGVMDGASLRMWREYYPKAEIIGVDNAMQSDLKIEGVGLVEIDATNELELKELGKFDIIIDDASHKTSDQQKTFEQLFYNQLNKNGIYILEDLHTSYIPSYVNSELTTIDYLKKKKDIKVTYFQRDKTINDSITCTITRK